ncbi:hypothetical protein N431DRAFT_128231 [Stipitochalara longipes BDJ]|nr:hypothetical protein N431DRAFT_128231 [Stipitochalara longipes BDJ]
MVESTIIRTPNLRQLHGRLCSPSGWDRIDDLTEKAQQAPAACKARLAPFGACCIQTPKFETDQIHKESRDGDPPGIWRGCWRCQPACAIAAAPSPVGFCFHYLPERRKCFTNSKALPHEATQDSGHLTLRHGADFSLPTASLGLGRPHGDDWTTTLQSPDPLDGCHDHLPPRKPHSLLDSRIIRVLHTVTHKIATLHQVRGYSYYAYFPACSCNTGYLQTYRPTTNQRVALALLHVHQKSRYAP